MQASRALIAYVFLIFLTYLTLGEVNGSSENHDWGYPIILNHRAGEYPSQAPTWTTLKVDEELLVGGDELLVYNGYEWTKLSLPGVFAIRGLCLDPKDPSIIWVGGQGNFGTLENGKFTSRSPDTQVAIDVDSIYPLAESVIACSDDILIRASISDDGTTKLETWELPNTRNLRGVADPWNERVLVHQLDTGIWEVKEGSPPKLLCSDDVFKPSMLVGLFNEAGKTILLTSKQGLWELQDDVLKPYETDIDDQLDRAVATSAAQESDTWYVGTFYDGLYIRENGVWTNLNKETGTPSNSVLHINLIENNGAWVGFNNALSLLDTSPEIRSLSLQNTIKDEIIDLDIDGDRGTVLTFGGIFTWGADTPMRRVDIQIPPAYNVVQIDRDTLAVGTIYGISKIDIHTGEILQTVPTPSDPFVLKPSKVPGKLLVTGDEFITEIDTQPTPWSYQFLAKDFSGSVRSLIEIDDDVYAARPTEGVLKINRTSGEIKEFPIPAEIQQESWLQILRIGDTPLLSSPNSIWELTSKGWEKLQSGQWDDRAMTDSPDGFALLIENEPRRITLYDGENSHEIPVPPIAVIGQTTKAILKDNTLWICGNQGILKIDNALDLPQSKLSKPSIAAVNRSSSGTVQETTETIQLKNGESFRVEMDGPLAKPYQEVYLQYRIPRLDKQWSKKSQDSTINISPLPHGHYQIEIRAIDNQGNQSEPVSIDVQVSPPWYLTTWALLLLILFVFAVAAIAYKIKLKVLEQRNRELQLRVDEKTEALRKAVRAKDEFMASVSHEIRNPLNGILGLCEILQERLEDRENKRTLSSLKNCTSVLTNLVEDILEIGSLQSGKMRILNKASDIEDILSSTIELFKKTAREKGLLLEFTLNKNFEHTCVIEIDPNRLKQILNNLISNAIKYTEEGKVSLILNAILEGGKVSLEIDCVDTGPGITDEDREKVFDLFTRREIHRDIPGSGLGLALCKKIAENLGGELYLKNTATDSESHGSTFSFTGIFQEAELPKNEARKRPLTNLQILIVEDEDYNREYLRLILERTSSIITEAESVKEALHKLTAQPFDVIFLDWNLKDGKGFDVIQGIGPNNKDAIIIAATAYTSAERKWECLNEGCNFVIQKPYIEEQIFEIIQDIPQRDTKTLERIAGNPFLQLELICKRNPERAETLKAEISQALEDSIKKIKIGLESRKSNSSEPSYLESEAAHKLSNLASITSNTELHDLSEYIEEHGATEELIQKVSEIIEDLERQLKNWYPKL